MDVSLYSLNTLRQRASGEKRQNKQLIRRLRKIPSRELDRVVHELHELWMDRADCLQCAHCCQTISPAVHDSDIRRISRHLRIKPSEMTVHYFRMDEEGDYVFTRRPCPFLQDDNRCSIYEVRPRACREYPHTDRAKIHQLLELSLRNTMVCPVVYSIFRDLREHYP